MALGQSIQWSPYENKNNELLMSILGSLATKFIGSKMDQSMVRQNSQQGWQDLVSAGYANQQTSPEGQDYALRQMGITDPYNSQQVAAAQQQPLAQRKNVTIPEKYKKYTLNQEKIPQGMTVDIPGMPFKYSKPQPDIMTQMMEYDRIKGNLPENFGVTGISGKNVQIGRNVQGEKLDLEQQEKRTKLDEKSQFVKDYANDTLNTIKEVENGIQNFGLFGQVPSIPGTERANWETNVNKLLSGKVIDLMTKMKEASKTGATGFGQLSEKELAVLQKASTALKRGLAPKDAQKYLNEIKAKLQKVTNSDNQGDFSSMSDDELKKIAAGG